MATNRNANAFKPAAAVVKAFQAYQTARIQFVESLATFLTKDDPALLDSLLHLDIPSLLCCPLIQDPVPGVQVPSINCLNHLLGRVEGLADNIAGSGVLDILVGNQSHTTPQVRRAAHHSIHSMAAHSPKLALSVLKAGALPAMARELEGVDDWDVKESAVLALDAMAQSGEESTWALFEDDAVIRMVISCLEDSRASAGFSNAVLQFLTTSASHSEDLAIRLVAFDALPALESVLSSPKTAIRTKTLALATLTQIAKHSSELAERVADDSLLESARRCLLHTIPSLRSGSCALLLQLARKNPQLATLVSQDGGIAGLVSALAQAAPEDHTGALASIQTLGHVAAVSERVAERILLEAANAPAVLVEALTKYPDNRIKGAAAWTLMQIAQHGTLTGGPVADCGALKTLHELYLSKLASEELKSKCKMALKVIITRSGSLDALESMMQASTSPDILQHVLAQLRERLARNFGIAGKSFVTSGALMQMLAVQRSGLLRDDAVSQDNIKAICSMFPEDVIAYYSSGPKSNT